MKVHSQEIERVRVKKHTYMFILYGHTSQTELEQYITRFCTSSTVKCGADASTSHTDSHDVWRERLERCYRAVEATDKLPLNWVSTGPSGMLDRIYMWCAYGT